MSCSWSSTPCDPPRRPCAGTTVPPPRSSRACGIRVGSPPARPSRGHLDHPEPRELLHRLAGAPIRGGPPDPRGRGAAHPAPGGSRVPDGHGVGEHGPQGARVARGLVRSQADRHRLRGADGGSTGRCGHKPGRGPRPRTAPVPVREHHRRPRPYPAIPGASAGSIPSGRSSTACGSPIRRPTSTAMCPVACPPPRRLGTVRASRTGTTTRSRGRTRPSGGCSAPCGPAGACRGQGRHHFGSRRVRRRAPADRPRRHAVRAGGPGPPAVPARCWRSAGDPARSLRRGPGVRAPRRRRPGRPRATHFGGHPPRQRPDQLRRRGRVGRRRREARVARGRTPSPIIQGPRECSSAST